MRTLVLSDTHVGDPRVKGEKVIKLLKKRNFDRLILNGDVLDFWFEDDIKVLTKHPLVQELISTAKDKEVVWVRGNHDHEAQSNMLPGIRVEESFEIIENNQRVFIVHGHRVYPFDNMAWYSRWGAKINAWIWKVFGTDFQRKLQKTCCYQKSVKKRRGQIIDKYGKPGDKIVSGHTHLVGYHYKNKVELLDIGSTVFTNTYAIVENGSVALGRV